MDLNRLALGLMLSASVFVGCGDDSGSTTTNTTPTTVTTNVTPDVGMCSDAGAATLYRLNVVHIPTPDEAMDGDVVGHNVDGAADTCGVPDYDGGVDNSLIDLAAALPALAPDDPVDLQAEIDAGLACPVGDTTCSRIDVIVSVRSGTGCAIIEVEDGEGTTLAGPFTASRDGSGTILGGVASLSLTIPYRTESDGTVDIALALSNVIVSGTVSPTGITDFVLGGALVRSAFEATIMGLLPQLGGDITFEDIGPILENLYDVEIGGMCQALSVGLTGSGVVYTPPT